MNAIKNDRYTYRITWSEEDKKYLSLCAEFPSPSWLAAGPETALRGIRAVVADVVKDMRANGETNPEPLSSRRYGGSFMIRVPPETHRRLVLEAAEAGVSRNRMAGAKLAQRLLAARENSW
jgi:predicted HicB family RNase H-like nuclease